TCAANIVVQLADLPPTFVTKRMGTAAPGCPAEQGCAISPRQNAVEPRSTGRPNEAVPTWFVANRQLEQERRITDKLIVYRGGAMSETRLPEPWLRGTLQKVPAVPRAVMHALKLAGE